MKHSSGLRLAVLALLLFLAACGAPIPGTGAPPAGAREAIPASAKPPKDDALDLDAQSYAADYGIEVEEARRRLALQDPIGALNAELAVKERDTFAGLWIVHTPEFRLFVRFTKDGVQTLQPYIAGGPLEGMVEVRPAEASLEELRAAQQTAMAALDDLGIEVATALNVAENRVEILVSDPVWFGGQLAEAGIRLPEHVELVLAGGQSARDSDICATPSVPGVVFPRQGPVEGPREVMEAELIGRLVLADGCLRIDSIHGPESYLPIWPPEFGLAAQGDEILVIDGEARVVAQVGEEVYMGGGTGSANGLAECVQEQLSGTCTGPYWIVGEGVRPNLRRDSDLFSLEVVEAPERSFFLLRKEPVLDGWIEAQSQTAGTLVLWDYERCPRLSTVSGLGNYLPLWPPDYDAVVEDGAVAIVDGSGQVVARVGDEVVLAGGPIPHSWDSEEYRRLYNELPGDCTGPYWIVND